MEELLLLLELELLLLLLELLLDLLLVVHLRVHLGHVVHLVDLQHRLVVRVRILLEKLQLRVHRVVQVDDAVGDWSVLEYPVLDVAQAIDPRIAVDRLAGAVRMLELLVA